MKDQKKAVWLALGAVACWSTVATAFKLSLNYFSPAQLLWVATLTAVILLLLLLAVQGRLSELLQTFKQRPAFFLLAGLMNPTLYYLVLFQAYDRLPAQQAQTLNYTWAITLTLLAVPFLGQTIRRQDWIAILLGYTGAMVIATRGDLLSLQFDDPLGVALALISTFIWAGYWILNTRNQSDPLISISLSFVLALPMITLATAILSDFQMHSWQGWVGAIYVGVFEMAIAFMLWLMAMRYAENTARISNLIFISPFASLILLRFLVGEQIYPATLVGLVMIVAALLIQQLKKSA
ncbi:Permease of the drug/metabolite transporter (DMT) superfamily [Nitrincola lacisaponensis]|uniref:Permease of the drug/metabolite transporter (DMT) superfamily n=1 Tax=Nitrincola lacisaponensis TaxID=267850 RepID=A0A063Y9W2_9GAMM|nr:DMT family transporter [Nitrincola lacisaponensis]KDE41456.1 Permease of the drug/metabolite transporter (DMT) superfamily [Nitrincola lacisaponensis]